MPKVASKRTVPVAWLMLGAAVVALIAGIWLRRLASQPPKRTELEELVAKGEPEEHVHAVASQPDGSTYVGLHSGIVAAQGRTGWKLQTGSAGDTLSLAPAGGTDLYVANPVVGIALYSGGTVQPLLGGQAHSVAVDPKSAKHVLGFLLDRGLQLSRDGGRTWNRILDPGQVDLLALAISPANPEQFAVGGLGNRFGWTSDGGKTWAWPGAPYGAVTGLAWDPSGAGVLWAAMGGKVFTTGDLGVTWSRVDTNIGDRSVIGLSFAAGKHRPTAVTTDGYLFDL